MENDMTSKLAEHKQHFAKKTTSTSKKQNCQKQPPSGQTPEILSFSL